MSIHNICFPGGRKIFSVSFWCLWLCHLQNLNWKYTYIVPLYYFFNQIGKKKEKKEQQNKKNLNLYKELASRWWMIRQALCCITTKLGFKLALLFEFSKSALGGEKRFKTSIKNNNKREQVWLLLAVTMNAFPHRPYIFSNLPTN